MKKHTIGAAGMTNPIPSHPLATRAGPFLFMSGQMGLSEAAAARSSSYEELGGEPPYPALGLLAPNTWEEAFVAQTRTIYDRITALLSARARRCRTSSSTVCICATCATFRPWRARARACSPADWRRR